MCNKNLNQAEKVNIYMEYVYNTLYHKMTIQHIQIQDKNDFRKVLKGAWSRF